MIVSWSSSRQLNAFSYPYIIPDRLTKKLIYKPKFVSVKIYQAAVTNIQFMFSSFKLESMFRSIDNYLFLLHIYYIYICIYIFTTWWNGRLSNNTKTSLLRINVLHSFWRSFLNIRNLLHSLCFCKLHLMQLSHLLSTLSPQLSPKFKFSLWLSKISPENNKANLINV